MLNNVQKISGENLYSANNTKQTGNPLSADEWNALSSAAALAHTKINDIIDNAGTGSGSSETPVVSNTSQYLYVNSKGNLCLESTVDNTPANKKGKLNIESRDDIQLKPGDDIMLYGDHRGEGKTNEVSVKVMDGTGAEDVPAKLQLNMSEITLTTKDKVGSDANVLDVNVNRAKDSKGYLKVRAQAIDLRCEEHGGIALQPKGKDGQNHMNKIKFEHGGGDGLEFGTFNTEKTSIFTDEYRFNKDGVWKMATRQTQASDKADANDPTTAYKYVKQADDFYDIINVDDAQTTTKDIIATAHAMNNDFIETSLSSKNNLKIGASSTYKIITYTGATTGSEETFTVDKTKSYFRDELKLILSSNDVKLSDLIDTKLPFLINGDAGVYRLSGDITPKIALEAEEEVDLDAKYGDVVLTSGDTIKCEAPEIRLNALNADKTGGVVNFGATQDVMFINSKLTKGLKVEASANPAKIKQVLQNNTIDTVYWDETNSLFRVPMKKVYADAEHTIEITPSNYSTYKEQPAYFEDGTRLPEDYTCFIWVTTENSGTYTTDIYKVSTKGSSDVLSKNIKGPVGRYTSSAEGVLGSRVSLGTSDELTTIEFEFPTYAGTTGVSAVQPQEFVTVSEVELGDIIALVNYMKTNQQGPWESTTPTT